MTDDLASRLRAALDSANLDGFMDLLAPDVTWGAPGDTSPACQNRAQVLAWYRRGREAGVRATVQDMERCGDKILVTLVVSRPGVEEALSRWQVLTVRDGLVADIRGFEERADADAAVGGSS